MRRTTRFGSAVVAAALAGVALSVLVADAALSDVRMGNFYFEDGTIGDGQVVITAGDQLRFIVEDSGPGTPHTVDIDAFGVHSGNLAKGDTFTTGPLTTPGEYSLYCDLHRNRGHKTTLIILPATATTTAPPTTTAAPAPTSTSPPTTTAAPGPASTTSTAAPPTGITTSTTGAPTGITTSTTSPTNSGETAADTEEPPSSGDPDDGEGQLAGAVVDDPGGDPPPPDDALAPTGRGEIDLETLSPFPVAPDSLEAILGRPPAGDGPWTRAVRSSLIALIPLALAAGAILIRYNSSLHRTG